MKALIIVDMQMDFMPGGRLPVPKGWELAEKIAAASAGYDFVVATQDYHPSDHCSFVTQKGPFPVHCVQGTYGAKLVSCIDDLPLNGTVRKGRRRTADSMSAFADDDGVTTGLHSWLLGWGTALDSTDICGVAGEYCVRATALHAVKYNVPKVRVLRELVGFVDATKETDTWKELEAIGVEVV